MNVQIGDKKTFDDWGLRLKEIIIGLPEAKTDPIDIPGADGVIDLTEALGPVRYANRNLELSFDIKGALTQWHGITSEIANYLHGRRLKLILDSDPDYYYIGRLSLDSQKTNYYMNRIVISGDMDPYKYELYSGIEPWLWDTFSLRNGIIRNYLNLSVEGTLEVSIPGRKKPVVPTFICTAPLEVEWQGKRYQLQEGSSKNFDIEIPEGKNILIFYGTGIVSIDYRGGIL